MGSVLIDGFGSLEVANVFLKLLYSLQIFVVLPFVDFEFLL